MRTFSRSNSAPVGIVWGTRITQLFALVLCLASVLVITTSTARAQDSQPVKASDANPSQPSTSPQPSTPTADDDQDSSVLPESDRDGTQAAGSDAELTDEQQALLDQWIIELGAKEFAARERAASRIARLGIAVIPSLRQAANISDDPEVRLRARQIIEQLTSGDMQAKIEKFLAGQEVSFPGWQTVRVILGDTPAVRELFVEMMKSHPGVTESMMGTVRDRAIAVEQAMAKVRKRIYEELEHPRTADVFALLLPMYDVRVPITANYDALLIDVMRKPVAGELRKDAQLNRPFKSLLARWLVRSSLAHREDALLLGMDWDLDATVLLAIQTLSETEQPDVLSTALQAIARFGRPEHSDVVATLLDNTESATSREALPGRDKRAELGDVAMATIALLHGLPLAEIGMPDARLDPKRGLILQQIGYPVKDAEARKKAHEKIDALLKAYRERKSNLAN